MAWQFIAGIALALLSNIIFRPKPPSNERPPASLSDIRAPTAEDGRAIPVLFGCRTLRGPNVVWYGHLRTTAIKSGGGKK